MPGMHNPPARAPFIETYWTSPDGLRLYARVYESERAGAKTVLCLHGLTRNSRDFEDLAPHLQARFRVIVPEPCCGDVEEGPHRDNLRDVGRRYADVVGLEEVLAYIETAGRRNTNEAP